MDNTPITVQLDLNYAMDSWLFLYVTGTLHHFNVMTVVTTVSIVSEVPGVSTVSEVPAMSMMDSWTSVNTSGLLWESVLHCYPTVICSA